MTRVGFETQPCQSRFPLLWRFLTTRPRRRLFIANMHLETRVTNRPGMAGTVQELTSGVPCPGLGHFCPGIY